ncbi:MAG: DUF3488 domain-containing protein, partial [Planctomycetes bacterium]|nr:DUF3488 domain-containing protein [Planctomycetota bacterium]
MRLDSLFRLSTYLTLAAASLALGYAETPFLPGIVLFGLLVALFLGLSYALEGRWTLPSRMGNVLALIIAAGSVAWVAYHFLRVRDSLAEIVPGPAAALPYLGPVLMVLLLAKLFRPKEMADWWMIHAIGFMEVVLACVLANEFLFALFLVLYLLCGLWSLALFYFYRGQSAVRPRPAPDARAAVLLSWPSLGIRPTVRWTFGILLAGLLLFLLTPQRGDQREEDVALAASGGTGLQAGFSEDMDLNRTGLVERSHDVAMEVSAEDANHQPKLDLNPDQRWRGATLEVYKHGRWYANPFAGPVPWNLNPFRRQSSPQTQLPDLGPDQYFLTFTVNALQTNQYFLADPVVYDPQGNLSPVISLQPNSGFSSRGLPYRNLAHLRYRQVVSLPSETCPALTYRPHLKQRFCQQPVPGIRSWTKDLLQQLVRQGKLSATDLTADAQGLLLPEHWEKVARALSNHLAYSGEFRYTLYLNRSDLRLDPTEDFLRNIKQGHCELYATALVLMLRSCGIPAQLVVGFRGAEIRGDGEYIVRQNSAHSWAEALIQVAGSDGRKDFYWLTLDPTPTGDIEGLDQLSWTSWWQYFGITLQNLWKNFVLEYNTDQQGEVVSDLWNRLKAGRARKGTSGLLHGGSWQRLWPWLTLVLVPLLGLGFWLFRRGRSSLGARKPSGPARDQAFYARLVDILARHCRLAPRPAETPREFAHLAAYHLRHHPSAA